MAERHPFSRKQVVRSYELAADLQKPEALVLQRLGGRLGEMSMLDVGVGGGRTTAHFAPLAKEYVAIDYSPDMIETCVRRFPDLAKRDVFRVGDARSMEMFPDGGFDFVLFSFNGIDCVSLADRERILTEIHRVGRPGGYLLFSSHNLNADIELGFTDRLWSNPKILLLQVYRHLVFRVLNRGWRRAREGAEYMIINDGAHGFPTIHFYIRPMEQVRRLRDLGFVDIEVLALDGSRLEGESALAAAEDPWLYYFCRIESREAVAELVSRTGIHRGRTT